MQLATFLYCFSFQLITSKEMWLLVNKNICVNTAPDIVLLKVESLQHLHPPRQTSELCPSAAQISLLSILPTLPHCISLEFRMFTSQRFAWIGNILVANLWAGLRQDKFSRFFLIHYQQTKILKKVSTNYIRKLRKLLLYIKGLRFICRKPVSSSKGKNISA